MKHKGVEYTIVASTMPDVWNYEFRIGEKVKSGKTETRISSLAIRRVQLRIDRALKDAAQKQGAGGDDRHHPTARQPFS